MARLARLESGSKAFECLAKPGTNDPLFFEQGPVLVEPLFRRLQQRQYAATRVANFAALGKIHQVDAEADRLFDPPRVNARLSSGM